MRDRFCFPRRWTGIHALADIELLNQMLKTVLIPFSPTDCSRGEVTIGLTCSSLPKHLGDDRLRRGSRFFHLPMWGN